MEWEVDKIRKVNRVLCRDSDATNELGELGRGWNAHVNERLLLFSSHFWRQTIFVTTTQSLSHYTLLISFSCRLLSILPSLTNIDNVSMATTNLPSRRKIYNVPSHIHWPSRLVRSNTECVTYSLNLIYTNAQLDSPIILWSEDANFDVVLEAYQEHTSAPWAIPLTLVNYWNPTLQNLIGEMLLYCLWLYLSWDLL